jgi:hypothetical protein
MDTTRKKKYTIETTLPSQDQLTTGVMKVLSLWGNSSPPLARRTTNGPLFDVLYYKKAMTYVNTINSISIT